MITRRNFLTTVAIGSASAAALAACGSPAASQTGTAENPVTINYTWWGNDDRAERTRKAIALFEGKNPDIKVNGNFTDFAGYWQKRATEAAGGGLPDVMQWDLSYLRDYGQRNQLLDLGTVKIDTLSLREIPPAVRPDQGQDLRHPHQHQRLRGVLRPGQARVPRNCRA